MEKLQLQEYMNTALEAYKQKDYETSDKFFSSTLAGAERLEANDSCLPQILDTVATFYHTQSKFVQAAALYERSLQIWGELLSPSHPHLVHDLDFLALCYRAQGNYAKAESLYNRSLRIREGQASPLMPTPVCGALQNLASLYVAEERYAHAEQLYKQSIQIWAKDYGTMDSYLSSCLNGLAELYSRRGHYAVAEAFYRRSLFLLESTNGPDDPRVLEALRLLRDNCKLRGNFGEATKLDENIERVMQNFKARDGFFTPDDSVLDAWLYNLAEGAIFFLSDYRDHIRGKLHTEIVYYSVQYRYAEAEAFCRHGMSRIERLAGPAYQPAEDWLWLAGRLADLCQAQEKYAEAELILRRLLEIWEQRANNRAIAKTLRTLAELYVKQGKYAEARPVAERSIQLEGNAPLSFFGLICLANIYTGQGQYLEAESLYKHCLKTSEGKFNEGLVITSLHGLADLYKAQHKFEAAEQQLERALRIREQTIEKFFAENAPRSTSGRLTPEQVRVAQTLAEIAELYSVQGKQTEAETLYDRSLKLCEQVVGPDHLENVKILESYARFLNQSKRDEQAKSLYARVVKIREKSFLAS